MNAYIISIVVAVAILLIAALISTSIKYQGGANPKDSAKRKMVFWILMILAPVLTYVLGAFIIHPDKNTYPIEYDKHMQALPVGAGIAALAYIVLGFVLSKIFRNKKIGNWF